MSESDRSTAFSELSTTLLAQADLAGARDAAEQAVALSHRDWLKEARRHTSAARP